jgi:hypothetical protein
MTAPDTVDTSTAAELASENAYEGDPLTEKEFGTYLGAHHSDDALVAPDANDIDAETSETGKTVRVISFPDGFHWNDLPLQLSHQIGAFLKGEEVINVNDNIGLLSQYIKIAAALADDTVSTIAIASHANHRQIAMSEFGELAYMDYKTFFYNLSQLADISGKTFVFQGCSLAAIEESREELSQLAQQYDITIADAADGITTIFPILRGGFGAKDNLNFRWGSYSKPWNTYYTFRPDGSIETNWDRHANRLEAFLSSRATDLQ